MNQKHLALWLKVIIAGIACCGAILYLYIIPEFGRGIASHNPEYAFCYPYWLGVLWISAVPCYLVLYFGWQIVNEIAKDRSFSMKNAAYLKYISLLAAGDSAYFFVANLVLLMLNMSHPGVFILAMFVIFAGVAVTVAAAALSHLVQKAAAIEEENKLTI